MKTLSVIGLLLITFFAQTVKAQKTTGGQGNFVLVIGAFAVEKNADKMVKQVRKTKLNAVKEFNKEKSLYYVHILQTDEHDAAIDEVKKLQAGSFKDAWVFTRVRVPVVIIEPVVVKVEEKPVIIENVPVVKVPVMTKADSVKVMEDKIKADVDKKKMTTKKGETEKLDNIFFYKDSDVLRPESRFAVDKLVSVMKDNPKEVIRIHGHTNGDDPGKIIKRATAGGDIFSLDNTLEDYGSAKQLSELRANTIRDYLLSNGIEKKRMSVKAWGGKKPLVNVDDEKAEANVRVEIEVVKN